MSINKNSSDKKSKKFEDLATKFKKSTALKQYKTAIKHAQLALKIVPNHMLVISDLAFCLLRDKQYQAAYYQYKIIFHASSAQQQQASSTWLDGLAEVCGWLKKDQELQRYGCSSLRKADQYSCQKAKTIYPINDDRPLFQTEQKKRNIISFSLFGNLPKYCESAVINAQTAKKLYPDWICRFYVAQDVPQHVITRLQSYGAQIILKNSHTSEIHPLMWRFLVLDDPNVDFYLIRDADSLLSEKDQAAVSAWLTSKYWFHHMRDYFTHTELLLAGMWGGARGCLPDIQPLMLEYCKAYQESDHFIDQYFLKEALWPTVKQSLLCHDDIFKFHDAVPYPAHAPIRWLPFEFHIGSNCSYHQLEVAAKKASGMQEWRILAEDGYEICRYTNAIINGKVQLNLPFIYVANFNNHDWKIDCIN